MSHVLRLEHTSFGGHSSTDTQLVGSSGPRRAGAGKGTVVDNGKRKLRAGLGGGGSEWGQMGATPSAGFLEDPERKYHFECCSEEQCQEWMTALRRARWAAAALGAWGRGGAGPVDSHHPPPQLRVHAEEPHLLQERDPEDDWQGAHGCRGGRWCVCVCACLCVCVYVCVYLKGVFRTFL